jgi:hypothetical protein
MNSIEYQLQSVHEISGVTHFTCTLVTNISPKDENIKHLRSKKTGFRWKVGSVAFLPAKQVKAGIRMYGVAPIQRRSDAIIGDILIGEQ